MGKEEYQGLHTCVVTLLQQVQADHERQQANTSAWTAAANLDGEYQGPLGI